jgi:hypothetical protein
VAESDTAAGAARRFGSGASRVVRAWRALPHEQRLAAYAAIGLLLALFLPWYQRHFFNVIGGRLQPAADSQTAWAAFSWVEAAVLLVAAGVLTLLFNRAEGHAFHVPGGDGGVIAAAGSWTCLLIIWRIFDKQGASSQGQYATTYGIEWGIFIALVIAALLVYAGNRIRSAHLPEPPLPGERSPPAGVQPARAPSDQRAQAPRPVRAEGAPPRGGAPPRADAPPRAAAPPRAPRSRRPLPHDEQLTIPLEERGEE